MAARRTAARPAAQKHVAEKTVAAKPVAGKPVRGGHAARKPPPPSAGREEFTRVYVSAGRAAGVRPTDLVGALTAGAGIPREAIGGIELDDRFSLVEVRDADADAVVEALRRVKIRGRDVTASRYRPPRTRRG
jgi:ATP-dependent RNA helicase DeaD